MKNQMIINWDEYFMGVALLSAKRSKDPSTQVGACVVNRDNRIVSLGYNGMPRGCSDLEFPWGREGSELESKYVYVVHAELNAILNSTTSLKDCVIYTGLFPCNECCKAIIQSGITKVVYISDKYKDTPSVKASKKMFTASGVEFCQLKTDLKELSLSFLETDI